MKVAEHRIISQTNLIQNDWLPFLESIDGHRHVSGAQPRAVKSRCFLAVRFHSDELALGRATPKVGPAGAEESARETAERQDQFAGIVAFKSSVREFKKELLKRLRMRRRREPGISLVARQLAPSAISKRLKISKLCKKATPHSQIESSKNERRGANMGNQSHSPFFLIVTSQFADQPGTESSWARPKHQRLSSLRRSPK